MMNLKKHWILAGVAACLAIAGLSMHPWLAPRTLAAEPTINAAAESEGPIQPIEAPRNLDPRKVELGKRLFADPRLSHDNSISCATCHDLKSGGTDRMARSTGIHGAVGIINAPTVLNSGFNFSQFWDGRASTLEQQVEGPVLSKLEMGSTWPEVITKIGYDLAYVTAFRAIYRDGVQSENVKNSIAEYERSLATPNSRFDRYLRHDVQALTAREQQGYELFKSFGCASCHQGVGVGGNMYQKMGVMEPYFSDPASVTKADRGRYNVTGDPRDLYMFKVPSLRNVELTAPYFHNGSAETLADAVRMMARHQLSRPLTDPQVELIVEFLKTLTGQLDGHPL